MEGLLTREISTQSWLKIRTAASGRSLCATSTTTQISLFHSETHATSPITAFLSGSELPPGLMEGIRGSVADVERDMGRGFGSAENPLLLSVRSGAAVSQWIQIWI